MYGFFSILYCRKSLAIVRKIPKDQNGFTAFLFTSKLETIGFWSFPSTTPQRLRRTGLYGRVQSFPFRLSVVDNQIRLHFFFVGKATVFLI